MFTFLSGLYMIDALYNHGAVLLDAATNIKAAYMAVGALFGIFMWFNVWFIIWPRQKKIIGAAQGGPAVDPKVPKQAALASKINTYLSVPLLLGMMGAHDVAYELPGDWMGLVVGILIGFAVVWLAYKLAPKVETQIFKAA